MRLVATSLAAVLLAAAPSTDASSVHEIDSPLVIAKSSNKNQVHYALDVDDRCEPAGGAPVHAYWRMYEHGPDATEPLTAREERAFGIERQDVTGADVRVVLRGLPNRPVELHSFRGDGGRCGAAASATIRGASVRLSGIYVKLSLFGVSYIELTGFAPSGASVSERLSPP